MSNVVDADLTVLRVCLVYFRPSMGKSWLSIVYDRGVCQLEMAYDVLKLKQHGR